MLMGINYMHIKEAVKFTKSAMFTTTVTMAACTQEIKVNGLDLINEVRYVTELKYRRQV